MAKVSDVIDVNEDEPTSTLPEHASGGGRDDLMQSMLDSADDDGMAQADTEDEQIAELAEQTDEPTIEQLRELAGKDGEGLTDDELQAEYKKAQEEEDFKLPFPVYDAQGNKIEGLDKLTLQDLLSGKVQIGYNAMGKEQRKALNDILRVAANGHLNESKMATSIAERNQVAQKLQELQAEHSSWATQRQTWNAVLGAAHAGNFDPLKQLIAAYGRELSVLPEPVADNSAELEQAGLNYFVTNVAPEAVKIAVQYGADPAEVTRAAHEMIVAEGEFLTQEKLDNILKYELQALLESSGYTAGAAPVPTQSVDIAAEVKRQVDAALAVQKTNATTERVRNRMRNAPPAGAGSTPGAGTSMPAMKSREDMKKWLRGETE